MVPGKAGEVLWIPLQDQEHPHHVQTEQGKEGLIQCQG
jgi:hypothetical protein